MKHSAKYFLLTALIVFFFGIYSCGGDNLDGWKELGTFKCIMIDSVRGPVDTTAMLYYKPNLDDAEKVNVSMRLEENIKYNGCSRNYWHYDTDIKRVIDPIVEWKGGKKELKGVYYIAKSSDSIPVKYYFEYEPVKTKIREVEDKLLKEDQEQKAKEKEEQEKKLNDSTSVNESIES